MARWQRDPRARRNVAAVLAAAEVLLGGIVFFVLVSGYILRIGVRVARGVVPYVLYIAGPLTILVAAGLVYLAIQYVKGQERARRLFIGFNALLVLAGLVWFLLSLVAGSESAEAVWYGLGLPMLTVFPLTAPLMGFRPKMDAPPPAGPGPPGRPWR